MQLKDLLKNIVNEKEFSSEHIQAVKEQDIYRIKDHGKTVAMILGNFQMIYWEKIQSEDLKKVLKKL